MSTWPAEVCVPIKSLTPIQAWVVESHLLELADVDPLQLPPVEAVLSRQASPAHPMHILTEGHHRAYNAYRRGDEDITTLVASKDEHLTLLTAKTALWNCRTIEEVVKKYRNRWQVQTLEHGVDGIEDLIVI